MGEQVKLQEIFWDEFRKVDEKEPAFPLSGGAHQEKEGEFIKLESRETAKGK